MVQIIDDVIHSSYKQYTVEIEDLNIHFVHEKSSAPNAIPLVMLHGWPGMRLSFPIINRN
jgi:hypothetical protein